MKKSEKEIEFLIKQDNILQNLQFWLIQEKNVLQKEIEKAKDEDTRNIIDAFYTTLTIVENKINEIKGK